MHRRLRHLSVLLAATSLTALVGLPANAAPDPVRHDLGTFNGVRAQWWAVQELKEQFRAGWGFENTSSETVIFSYALEFQCPGGKTHKETGSMKLAPGKKRAGQWEGLFAYPCAKTAPTSATLTMTGIGTTTCPPFTLTIHRSLSSEQCMTGYLAVNGTIIAYTLELPDLGNVQDISSIPAGRYKAKLRTDGGKWRLQLDDKETSRSAIQIHAGNNLGQIKGCILAGRGVDPKTCTVSNSGGAFEDVKKAFHGPDGNMSTCADRDVTVVVEGSPRTDSGAGQCRDMTACVKVRATDGGCAQELTNGCNRKVHCSYSAKGAGTGQTSQVTIDGPTASGEKRSAPICETAKLDVRCVDDADPANCKHL